ncbi:hypothetical protein PUMCH_003658 [Australozyma saopauloensis]|uniref:assimilatory sulfite reductase (NADPH) n=1 Tax=Australozyma saopauloensis TaxID=291208 RepID=A0AAX4HCM1_9ASCO|nr:hypothetical protein PUMCH_003658 [[Candida] saopauloensis]
MSGASSVAEEAASSHIIKANPFGASVDPHLVKNSVYTSAATVINQTIYSLASLIFSYETAAAGNLVDAHLLLWADHFKRQNALGTVPLFHRLEPRSGAANAIFGYTSAAGVSAAVSPVTAVLGANTLPYMQPVLAQGGKLPLSLNVCAVDVDVESGAVFLNYAAPLAVARALGVPVVSPTSYNAAEIQNTTVLNHFLAAWTGSPSVNLYDGPDFARTFRKFDSVLAVEDVGRLYQQLLASAPAVPASLEDAVLSALELFNNVAGTSLAPFEYEGHSSPETVYVVHGANEAAQVSHVVTKASLGSKVGVVKVRVPFPFAKQQFLAALPSSARNVVVLAPENSASSLKADVSAALFLGGRFSAVQIHEYRYPVSFVWTPITVLKVLGEFHAGLDELLVLSQSKPVIDTVTANTSPSGSFLIWTRDNSDLVQTAGKLALSLSLDDSKDVSIRNKFDTSVVGGVFQSQIVSLVRGSATTAAVDSADIVIIESASILDHFDVLATVKPGASVLLVNHKKIANSVEADVVEKLPEEFKRTLSKNQLQFSVIDFSIVEDLDAVSDSTKGFSADFLAQLAFWKAALPELGGYVVNKLLQANGNGFELLAAVLDKFVATVDEKNGVKAVEVLPEWAEISDAMEVDEEEKKEQSSDEMEQDKPEAEAAAEAEAEEVKPLPFFPTETSFFPNPRVQPPSAEDTKHAGVADLATKLTFPEAFGVSRDLRPDLPVKNFVVKVQENKRLTPSEYSRNIFHIEFDITGTGLKYEIGEALGIHGRNNSAAVEAFLISYGVDGDSLVEVSDKEDPSLWEIRSARQALLENVDFLGKPPKRFYESLAPFASDEKEKAALEKLASGEGAEELKKRQDVDFCSYVDILDEFKSARPSFDELVKIIAPLKRREYSIASSQKVHPNAVHLLIVVVDWFDSRGRPRFGHCSKYLSDLKIGDELVVSVKPSVMKLPKLPEQPIVMSGLGTGLAPFKAFIEEKVWQQAQGHTVGEIYLYMGSRHKKEEYLYGELWEAYKEAGILTHIGAAFSRDQPHKIYIQDKIRSSIEDLTDAICSKNGSFYLCGPTWPVPDITACLEDIVRNGAKKEGKEIADVAKVVEDMKEEGRYVLEVY